jgi:FtsZ-binding cell division protein ZapB
VLQNGKLFVEVRLGVAKEGPVAYNAAVEIPMPRLPITAVSREFNQTMKPAFPIFMIIILSTAAGCASRITPIYEDSDLNIRLEPNPAGSSESSSRGNAMLPRPEEFIGVLRGFYVQKKQGLFDYVIGGSRTQPVFPEDNLPGLASELLKGLRSAQPDERVAFQIWRTGKKGLRDETSGAMVVRRNILSVSVDKFRVLQRVSYEGAEGGSGRDFDLLFEPPDAIVERQKGLVKSLLGSDRPEVKIDLNRLSGTAPFGDTAQAIPAATPIIPPQRAASPASPESVSRQAAAESETIRLLQQKITELTESNQKLMKASSGKEEELIKLREQLAEAKEALANKVLELDRLQSKSRGKQPAPSP